MKLERVSATRAASLLRWVALTRGRPQRANQPAAVQAISRDHRSQSAHHGPAHTTCRLHRFIPRASNTPLQSINHRSQSYRGSPARRWLGAKRRGEGWAVDEHALALLELQKQTNDNGSAKGVLHVAFPSTYWPAGLKGPARSRRGRRNYSKVQARD